MNIKERDQRIIKAHQEALVHLKGVLESKSNDPAASVYYNDKTDIGHLLWMIEQINTNDMMSVDKVARWMGFIQGVMVMRGFITVDEERDRTRGIFTQARAIIAFFDEERKPVDPEDMTPLQKRMQSGGA
jgi:hypothetical protein